MKMQRLVVGVEDWVLAQVKPGGFDLARRNLERQGFETFMPMQMVTGRRATRFQSKLRPLFPGYLFVATDGDAAAWRPLNSTYGVARLVRFDAHRPARIPAAFIDGLKARTDAAGVLHSVRDLTPGDQVRVVQGPFANTLGRILAAPDRDRVVILLELMGQEVRAEIGGRSVERVT